MNSHLGRDRVTLESGSWVIEPQEMLVTVARVDLQRGLLAAAAPDQVVKFSEPRFAIPQHDKLRLSTARFFRDQDEPEGGIGDEFEARQTRDIHTVLKETGSSELLSSNSSLSGEVTYGTDDFWIFSTSVMPHSTPELERMRQRFSYECATSITSPSEFARQLGEMFAVNSTEADLQLEFPAQIQRWVAMLWRIDGIVRVYHGPVLYDDNPEETVFSLPPACQAIAATFVKRKAYNWQSEYRFAVSTIGTPATDELYLPISDEMKALAEIESS